MKIFLRVQFIALITFSESEFGHQRIHRSGKKKAKMMTKTNFEKLKVMFDPR